MEIRNATKLPVKVSLPGGKKLRLGPGKTGQITAKAAEHPPVAKMIEAGELEILDAGKSGGNRDVGGGKGAGGSQRSGGGSIRHVGDR